MDRLHVCLALKAYALHVRGPYLQSRGGPRSVLVCMLVVYAAVCVCMCVFAAHLQYKRGHRKTASLGTILDVPKIVVTGITGPLGFLVIVWIWLGMWVVVIWQGSLACVSLHVMFLTGSRHVDYFSVSWGRCEPSWAASLPWLLFSNFTKFAPFFFSHFCTDHIFFLFNCKLKKQNIETFIV